MSRLMVLTRPGLASGFRLAGVSAVGVEDVEAAQEMIAAWLDAGEAGLLAIDDGLLPHLDRNLMRRLEAAEQLPYVAIPGGHPLSQEISRKYRIAEMIRRAIGIHITFRGEEAEAGKG